MCHYLIRASLLNFASISSSMALHRNNNNELHALILSNGGGWWWCDNYIPVCRCVDTRRYLDIRFYSELFCMFSSNAHTREPFPEWADK